MERFRSSGVVDSGLGFPALDTAGLEAWFRVQLSTLAEHARDLRRIIVTTHGAAVASLRDEKLVLPVPDYEWAGFDERPPSWESEDEFASTLSPVLPRGLNMGVQLDWLERHCPHRIASVDILMPYPQYWAWWLSGVASSEVTSLGCHTLLWNPSAHTYSDWAVKRGWAGRFAPLRRAWECLGSLRSELAQELGLPQGIQVHVGAHDSNACLAHYLRSWPRMTLVSTGTWIVVMAPGSTCKRLDPSLDQLGNVSVRGEAVPTGRFMGGRELALLCAGADPGLAQLSLIEPLLTRGLKIFPAFEKQGGPFPDMDGEILLDGRALSLEAWPQAASPAERATAASMYTAFVTARTVEHLGGFGPIVVEGPFAHNPVYMATLSTLLRHMEVHASAESIEGTVRGSWCLTRWTEASLLEPRTRHVAASEPLHALLQPTWRSWPRPELRIH